MSTWIAWRIVKLLAVVLLAGGVFGVVLRPDRAGRLHVLHRLATPGMFLAWFAGYALTKEAGLSLGTPWIGAAMGVGLLGFQGVVTHAHRARPTWGTASLALGGLLATVAVMVARSSSPTVLAACCAVGLALGGAVARVVTPEPGLADPSDAARSWAWFRDVARVEGTSLVLLMLIAMPLRRATGIHLDGGTGLLGWAHGVLAIVYVVALATVSRTLGWSWGRTLGGFVASVVPLGTFVFERRVARDVAPEVLVREAA